MNSDLFRWLVGAWAVGALAAMVMMVNVGRKSTSSFKWALFVVGFIACLLWPALLPVGFIWGIVAGIKENRADVVKAKEATRVRAAIFAQYPMFKDDDQ